MCLFLGLETRLQGLADSAPYDVNATGLARLIRFRSAKIFVQKAVWVSESLKLEFSSWVKISKLTDARYFFLLGGGWFVRATVVHGAGAENYIYY